MNRKRGSTLRLLQRFESRNITFIEDDGSWPIVWRRASGVHVWDDSGRKYLDLTGAFGVAAAGHANRNVVRAAQAQMKELQHRKKCWWRNSNAAAYLDRLYQNRTKLFRSRQLREFPCDSA